MEKEQLVKALSVKLKRYKSKAKQIKIDKKYGDTIFIQHKGETLLNPKYISLENYFEIFAFESFLKEHDYLTKEQVAQILDERYMDFIFLRKLFDMFGNMMETINTHGAKAVAIMYVNEMLYPKKESDLEH